MENENVIERKRIKSVSDCCLTPNEQSCSYVIKRTSYIQCNSDDVHVVLDQYALFYYYSANSMKQQSGCRLDAPLEHIILVPRQPVFALTP